MEVNGTTAKISTDVLIIGTGPAGGALACFLASHGVKGMMISSAPSTAATPRAHYTNSVAIECLRDIGLEEEFINQATPSVGHYTFYRWVYSIAGEQYARMQAFGQDTRRMGDYLEASPCKHADLPQTLAEPMLVRYATQNGFQVRWNTKFVRFTQNKDTVTTTVLDTVTGHTIYIESKYLAGADGARSEVLQQLDLELTEVPNGSLAYNVLVEAEMSHLMKDSEGLLHVFCQPDKEHPDFASQGIARMVKPWHEWLFIYFCPPWVQNVTATDDEWAGWTRNFIGDDSVKLKIINVAKWRINECYAKEYSRGRVFCLGDAVHRHPPINGLGSNTCIQDAYNLAWKMAYVLQGRAASSLLDTYNTERQPVGAFVVKRANDSMRDVMFSFGVLGMYEPSVDRRREILQEFGADSEGGRERRAGFRKGMELQQDYMVNALGAEMNQQYQSTAVYFDDEKAGPPEYPKDPDLYYEKTTYPGRRLPHAWLNATLPIKSISTHDLAGKGCFAILTGIGGKEVWTAAAAEVSKELNVTINVTSIGWRQDYEDSTYRWESARGVAEDGAVLVRPDRFVAWRCMDRQGATAEKLGLVMRKVLGVSVDAK